MSAKHPAKAILLRLPEDLRPVLRAARRARRSSSSADALRWLVQRALSDPGGFAPSPAGRLGRVLRLQLPPADRAQVAALAARHRCDAAAVICGLLRKAATMPQDNPRRGPIGTGTRDPQQAIPRAIDSARYPR